MDYKYLLEGIEKFGPTPVSIIENTLNISKDKVCERVIIAPSWIPNHLKFYGNIECLNESRGSAIRIYNIKFENVEATYIRTGIGAPATADIVLQLGLTACKRILFVGSVGATDKDLNIGDIIIPKYSVSGDGFSRYLTDDMHDVFGEKSYPNKDFSDKLYDISKKICKEEDIAVHKTNVFSVDSIFSQFVHIDEIMNMECGAIDMETAAGFRAAKIAGIPAAALLQVSDNMVQKKSLYGGRSDAEMAYRRQVRQLIFPKIILASLISI